MTIRVRFSARHRCIYRAEYSNSPNVDDHRAGWYLNVGIARCVYRAYFADFRYGGKQEALRAAETERDWIFEHRRLVMNKIKLARAKGTGRRGKGLVVWAIRKVMEKLADVASEPKLGPKPDAPTSLTVTEGLQVTEKENMIDELTIWNPKRKGSNN